MAKENLEKNLDGTLDAATDLLPDGVKIDDDVKIDDIFVDDDKFFDDHDLKTEDCKYLEDLLQKKNFAVVGTIVSDVIEFVRKKKCKSRIKI